MNLSLSLPLLHRSNDAPHLTEQPPPPPPAVHANVLADRPLRSTPPPLQLATSPDTKRATVVRRLDLDLRALLPSAPTESDCVVSPLEVEGQGLGTARSHTLVHETAESSLTSFRTAPGSAHR
jgi:hypothetical protein